jgi:site-specific DNA recombinase
MLAFAELRKRASEADAKLKRLYDVIENGVIDLSDLMLKVRIAELKAIRDQMRIESGGYRRDYLRALAQRVEVDARTSHHGLEKRAAAHPAFAASSAKTAGVGVPSFVCPS